MKIVESLQKIHTREGKGVFSQPPQSGIKRLLFVIRTYYVTIVYLNVLFVLFSVPIITIPAAIIALNRCIFELDRYGAVAPLHDFLQAFSQAFKRSLLYLIVMAGFCIMVLLFLYLLYMPDEIQSFSGISFILSIIICVYLWNLLSYAFLMDAVADLKPATILKNAAILAFTQWKSNAVISIASGLYFLVISLLFPYSIAALFLFGFSLLQLLIKTTVMKPIEKYVLAPYSIPAKGCQ